MPQFSVSLPGVRETKPDMSERSGCRGDKRIHMGAHFLAGQNTLLIKALELIDRCKMRLGGERMRRWICVRKGCLWREGPVRTDGRYWFFCRPDGPYEQGEPAYECPSGQYGKKQNEPSVAVMATEGDKSRGHMYTSSPNKAAAIMIIVIMLTTTPGITVSGRTSVIVGMSMSFSRFQGSTHRVSGCTECTENQNCCGRCDTGHIALQVSGYKRNLYLCRLRCSVFTIYPSRTNKTVSLTCHIRVVFFRAAEQALCPVRRQKVRRL